MCPVMFSFLSKERCEHKQKLSLEMTHNSYLLDGFPEIPSNKSLLSVFSLTWGIFTSCIPSIYFHSCVRVSCHPKISTSVSCISVRGFIRLLYKQYNSMRAFCHRKSTPCSQNVLNWVSKKPKRSGILNTLLQNLYFTDCYLLLLTHQNSQMWIQSISWNLNISTY